MYVAPTAILYLSKHIQYAVLRDKGFNTKYLYHDNHDIINFISRTVCYLLNVIISWIFVVTRASSGKNMHTYIRIVMFVKYFKSIKIIIFNIF